MQKQLARSVVAFLLVLPLVGTAPAVADHFVGGAHWADRSLTIVDRSGDSNTRAATRNAVDEWNSADANIRLSYDQTSYAPPSEGCNTLEPGVVPVFVGGPRNFGVAGSCGSAGHNTVGRVVVNFADNTNPVCHELGHILGIGHPPSGFGPCDGQGNVTDHEADLLRGIYAHCTPGDCLEPAPQPKPTTTTTTTQPREHRACPYLSPGSYAYNYLRCGR